MNSIAAHLAADCGVRSRVQVSSIVGRDREWVLHHDQGEDGPYDITVVAVPAPQAVPLLEAAPMLQSRVAAVSMNACWAVLLGLESPLEIDFDGAFVNQGPLSWIARNRSKPGRRSETWILHASPGWTERHLESEPDRVLDQLVKAFRTVAGVELPGQVELQAHRWRYAIPANTLSAPCLFDAKLGLAVCGDWCGGPRIEGAFLSGCAAAGRILGWLAGETGRTQLTLL
jgi:predicted NAD/FAD-dependent oxidoreductase